MGIRKVAYMRQYYSQLGEDYILWSLFQTQGEPGFFVEVGALDGLRFSNTYSFEQAGWRGVCVEAHPDYIDLLQRNRPGSRCFFAAAGDHEGEVTFYTNKRGSLSTLDPSLEAEFRKHGKYFTGFEPKVVPMRTLNSILEEAQTPTPIDIVSIDVEGAEMQVMRGFDLAKFQPRILVLEAMGTDFEQDLAQYMSGQGYAKAKEWNGNIFYCRSESDVTTLSKTAVECIITHLPHPLDRHQEPRRFMISETKSRTIIPLDEYPVVYFLRRLGKRVKILAKQLQTRLG